MQATRALDRSAPSDPKTRSPSSDERGAPIALRGRSRGLEIVLGEGAGTAEVAAELEAKLEEAPHFFAGGDVHILFEERLPAGCLSGVEEVAGRYAMRVCSVRPRSEAKAPVRAGGEAGADAEKAAAESDERPRAPEPPAPRMVAGPVRSGTVLEAPANVVIVGDVNPGAEVVAQGNIVVLGTLRGVAHAACAGEPGFVLALVLAPQQLRIGEVIARASDADRPSGGAEIAYAKGGQILVEAYRGKLPGGLQIAAR